MNCMRGLVAVAILASAFLVGSHTAAETSPDPHDTAHGEDHSSLHFVKPLTTIYPNVATEIEGKYIFLDEAEAKVHELELELAYALYDFLGLEMKIPFAIHDPDADAHGGHATSTESSLGNISVGAKLQHDGFADRGVLVGYGLGLEFPSGDHDKGIGSSEIYSLEPFYSVGYKPADQIQLIASGKFIVPLNSDHEEEAENEFDFAASALYAVTGELRVLLEVDGVVPMTGHDSGDAVVNMSPGVKYGIGHGLDIGLGVGFPLTSQEEFDVRVTSSLLLEF